MKEHVIREGEGITEPTHIPTASTVDAAPQHTPGPWVVESADWPDDEPGIVRYYVRHHPPVIGMMNARLIAAAPDMLAALKALAAACILADSLEELPPEVDGLLLDAAHAAIAKAEGR